MSFKCDFCHNAQANKSRPNKIIVERREHQYPIRYRDNNPNNEIIDKGGSGLEIVREISVCNSCVAGIELLK